MGFGLRWLVRAALIFMVFMVAWIRGYANERLIGLAIALMWALALPYLLKLAVRFLRGTSLPRGQQTAMIWLVAGVLLLGFAIGAKQLLGI